MSERVREREIQNWGGGKGLVGSNDDGLVDFFFLFCRQFRCRCPFYRFSLRSFVSKILFPVAHPARTGNKNYE